MDIIQKIKDSIFQKKVVDVTLENYNPILSSGKPILFFFWAEHCGLCKRLNYAFEELAIEHYDKMIFARIDTNNLGHLKTQYQVDYLPTMIMVKNYTEIDRRIGNLQKNVLNNWILSK
jgi:thioredoxin 1